MSNTYPVPVQEENFDEFYVSRFGKTKRTGKPILAQGIIKKAGQPILVLDEATGQVLDEDDAAAAFGGGVTSQSVLAALDAGAAFEAFAQAETDGAQADIILSGQYDSSSTTRLECDFSFYPHGTEIIRGVTMPQVGNAWRWSANTVEIAPIVVSGAIQARPGAGMYFGNDVGSTIRSISFDIEQIGTGGTNARNSPTFAFHHSAVLNPSSNGILLPAGMLHINTTLNNIQVGYGIRGAADFNLISSIEETFSNPTYWNRNAGASGGNQTFGKRYVITFEFNGDEMTVLTCGQVLRFKHPAILAAAPRHFFYQCSGNNPATVGEYPRLHRVWANSPKWDSLPNQGLPEIVGDLQTSGPIFIPNTGGVRYGIDWDNAQVLTFSGNAVEGETVTIGGQSQAIQMTVWNAATSSVTGSATATVGGVDYPVTFSITNGDSSSVVATALRAALNAVVGITSLYTVGGSANSVTLTRITRAANDDTLSIVFPEQGGIRSSFSYVSTKGIASNVYTWRATPSTAFDVDIGADSTASRNNLLDAINLASSIGTAYATGTTLNGSAYAVRSATGVALEVVPNQKNLTLSVAETMTNGAFAAKSSWKTGDPSSGNDGRHMFNGDVAVAGKFFARPVPGFALVTPIIYNDYVLSAAVASNGTTDQLLVTLSGASAAVAGASERWEIFGTFAATANTKQFKIYAVNVGGLVIDFGALSPSASGEPFVLTITKFYTGSGSGQPYVIFAKLETTSLGTIVLNGARADASHSANTTVLLYCTTTAASDIIVTGVQKINALR